MATSDSEQHIVAVEALEASDLSPGPCRKSAGVAVLNNLTPACALYRLPLDVRGTPLACTIWVRTAIAPIRPISCIQGTVICGCQQCNLHLCYRLAPTETDTADHEWPSLAYGQLSEATKADSA